MTEKRFAFLAGLITFDDRSTRETRRLQDKYALILDFFEEVNKKNGLMRYPTAYLAIDETLYPYRGRLGFKIYLPNKPAKFGLLYRSLCDASLPYTYYTLPYAGKPEDLQDNEYKKYYVTGTDNYSIYLIEELSKINSIQGCNISVDRFFTSVPSDIVRVLNTDQKSALDNECSGVHSR